MAPVVVDTNVPALANDLGSPFPACVAACVARLRRITRSGQIVLDDSWLILREYQANLRSSGQPGVGDAFLKWVLLNWASASRCCLVSVTPCGDKMFEEFPDAPELSGFDPDDRKFVAVALADEDNPPILQALDSEWWGYRKELAENGVTVDFLCPREIQKLHQRKAEG